MCENFSGPNSEDVLGDALSNQLELRKKIDDLNWVKIKNDPPLPPWLAFPDIPERSIGWRMGAGETHMALVFLYLDSIVERNTKLSVKISCNWRLVRFTKKTKHNRVAGGV